VIERLDETDKSRVQLGSKVLLKDMEYDDEFEYSIVGSAEADPTKNRISYESPVGEAIMGKSVGEVVQVNAPVGDLQYKIMEVK
jgi:transcription elongation factor GreA